MTLRNKSFRGNDVSSITQGEVIARLIVHTPTKGKEVTIPVLSKVDVLRTLENMMAKP